MTTTSTRRFRERRDLFFCLAQGLANGGPWAIVFMNKVLLATSRTYSFTYYLRQGYKNGIEWLQQRLYKP